MITCLLQGGLGNQLFILFTTIAYAIQNKHPVLFHYTKRITTGFTPRYTYWDTFLSALVGLTTSASSLNGLKPIREYKEGQYNELEKIELNTSAILYGYFQSFRYFQDEYYEISRMIGIAEMRYKYNDWFLKNGIDKLNTISMHVCLSDSKNGSFDYYKNSLRYIIDQIEDTPNITVLYFCEKVDIVEVGRNIAILQNIFTSCQFRYCNLESIHNMSPCKMDNISENNLANEIDANEIPCNYSINQILGNSDDEMIIMSNCKYNIIANSTFSWWAAYIGYMEDLGQHIVCYPNNTNADLYPKSWKNIY